MHICFTYLAYHTRFFLQITMVPETSEAPTKTEYRENSNWHWTLFFDIYFVLSFICLMSDCVLIIVIAKYRRLRNRKSNMLILHWTICDMTFQALHPVIFRLASKSNVQSLYHIMVCVMEEFCYMLLIVQVLFVVLLTFYWYYEIHDPAKLVKFNTYMTHWIIFVYCLGLFLLGIHIGNCATHFFTGHMGIMFSILGFLVYFLFTLIMNTVSLVKRKLNRSTSNPFGNINFILSNFFFFCKFSVLVATLVSSIFQFHSIGVMLAVLFAVSNSIFNLNILYIYDDDYKIFLTIILTWKCARYNDEFVNEPVTFANGDVESRI